MYRYRATQSMVGRIESAAASDALPLQPAGERAVLDVRGECTRECTSRDRSLVSWYASDVSFGWWWTTAESEQSGQRCFVLLKVPNPSSIDPAMAFFHAVNAIAALQSLLPEPCLPAWSAPTGSVTITSPSHSSLQFALSGPRFELHSGAGAHSHSQRLRLSPPPPTTS